MGITTYRKHQFLSLYLNIVMSLMSHSSRVMGSLKCEFDLSGDDLKQAFSLPHFIAFEPYIKAFQYKVLNFIFYTNCKLHKIGYTQDNSFCTLEPETMHHFLFYCSHARIFWDEFKYHYFGRTD